MHIINYIAKVTSGISKDDNDQRGNWVNICLGCNHGTGIRIPKFHEKGRNPETGDIIYIPHTYETIRTYCNCRQGCMKPCWYNGDYITM
jgi:hypothetical protein